MFTTNVILNVWAGTFTTEAVKVARIPSCVVYFA